MDLFPMADLDSDIGVDDPDLARLLEAVAAGDRSAYRRPYDETAPLLFAIYLRLMRNRERACDTFQDAMLKIWQKAHLFGLALAFGLALQPIAGMAEGEPRLAPSCRVSGKPMARLELLLGASTPNGIVGPRAWARFLATEVTPRFPEGITIFEGTGQWRRGSRRITREHSRLLLIWYEPDASSEARIEAIRAAYKSRFRQDSVMRVDGVSCVSF